MTTTVVNLDAALTAPDQEISTEAFLAQMRVDAVGRPMPQRKVHENGQTIRWDHARAARLMRDLFNWHIDLAAYYMRQVEAGCADATYDVRDALDQAYTFAPRAERETYQCTRVA